MRTSFLQKLPTSRDRNQRGFILVAVLWILAALATLASIYSVYMDNAAFATQVNDDRLQIRASALSGVELAAYQLAGFPEDARPPRGSFTFRLSHSTVQVNFVAEGARVDLNAAPKELLTGLFAAVGAAPEDATTLADRVVGWRETGSPTVQKSEPALYKAAGLGYAPRQAPFSNVLELSLVLGMPKQLFERLLPLVTIFSGQRGVDVRVASSAVLSALPNVAPDQVEEVLSQRAQSVQDGAALLALLGRARTGAMIKTTPAVRVLVDIRLDDGRTAHPEVVILMLKGGAEPYRTLSWRDGPL